MPSTSSYPRIYATVRRVPRGRVATYGQIAQLSGLAGQARLVGYAMFALPRTTTVPWHRVINAQGRISLRDDGGGAAIRQRILLEREGIMFDASDRISLAEFGWKARALTSSGKSAAPRRKRQPGR